MSKAHVFQLPTVTQVNCAHVNPRTEIHGEDMVRAYDLSLWMEGPNELLDLFDPQIREVLYCNRAADAGQQQLPDALRTLPDKRLEDLAPKQVWKPGERLQGYRFILDYGLGEEAGSNVDLTDCVVSKKWFEMRDNGVVRIGWLVSYAGAELDDEATRGRLVGVMGEKPHIQLIAGTLRALKSSKAKPKAAADGGAPDGQGTLDEGGGTSGPEDDEDDDQGGPDATDTFLAHHGAEASAS